jgi:hypothetical protein
MSHLAGLSVETLEQIFLPLHGQDIVRVGTVRPTPCDTVLILRGTGQVSRDFTDLFHSLSILQHRRELSAAGVVCNPCSSCDPTKSRGLRRECTCKQEHPCDAFCLQSNYLSFLHIPPPSSRKTVSGVSPTSFRALKISPLTTYSSENFLVVARSMQGGSQSLLLYPPSRARV